MQPNCIPPNHDPQDLHRPSDITLAIPVRRYAAVALPLLLLQLSCVFTPTHPSLLPAAAPARYMLRSEAHVLGAHKSPMTGIVTADIPVPIGALHAVRLVCSSGEFNVDCTWEVRGNCFVASAPLLPCCPCGWH